MKSFTEVSITTKCNKPLNFEGSQQKWVEEIEKGNNHSRRLKKAYIEAGGEVVETKRVENQTDSSWEGWEYKIGFPTEASAKKAHEIWVNQKNI